VKSIRKVMVVDDSQLMHSLYESLLPDMEVVHAYDGADALDQLPIHPDTDLILLDLKMPNMNGLTFLRASRRNPAFARIPIIIVTSESERGDVARALNTGAKGYLNKPFRRSELTQVIDRVFEEPTPSPEDPSTQTIRA
jgi:two-component system, chemotaxis family, chemotaxis protein CheY